MRADTYSIRWARAVLDGTAGEPEVRVALAVVTDERFPTPTVERVFVALINEAERRFRNPHMTAEQVAAILRNLYGDLEPAPIPEGVVSLSGYPARAAQSLRRQRQSTGSINMVRSPREP